MTQQINLCIDSLRPPQQRFSALTLLQALGVFVILAGALGASWGWSLQKSSESFRRTNAAQAAEIGKLKAAVAESVANAKPVDPALVSQLQDRRRALEQRELLVNVIQQGLLKPGEGHSDRLIMLSRSIPAVAWITALTADDGRLEVTGLTLETQALYDWVTSLSQYPLMRGLRLTSVTVEQKKGATADGSARPLWSFTLVNMEPPPVASPAALPQKGVIP